MKNPAIRVTDVRIVVMCKAPVAGNVKTRLTSGFSALRAAELHAAMACTVIERAKRLFDDVVIAADDPEHAFFSSFDLPVAAQGEGELGDRMQKLIGMAFCEGLDAVVVVGTDSPHMLDERLLEAVIALRDNDTVLGPVEDGGYDLVAMSAAYPIFEGVVWSTPQVLEQTMANIHRLNLSSRLLNISFDVDFPADVQRAIESGWNCPL